MAKLVFISSDFQGKACPLTSERITVGRADDNLLILRHESVSSKHCEILVNGPEILVHDLGSRNGTFINGSRISTQSQIKQGQRIRFGSIEAVLELEPSDRDYDEEQSAMTAIHLHANILRQQAQAPPPGAAAKGPVVLQGQNANQNTGEDTVIAKRPEPPAPGHTAADLAPRAVAGKAADSSSAKWWIALLLIGVVIGILYFVLRSH